MHKRLVTSLIVASVFLGASPAPAQYAAYPDGREPAYLATVYSDSSYTTVIGYLRPHCGYAWVQYTLEGSYQGPTQYELVGYCSESGWEPV